MSTSNRIMWPTIGQTEEEALANGPKVQVGDVHPRDGHLVCIRKEVHLNPDGLSRIICDYEKAS